MIFQALCTFKFLYHIHFGVRNAGFGGSRSCDVLKHIKILCLDWNPEIVVLSCVENDFVSSLGSMQKQLTKTCQSMKSIVEKVTSSEAFDFIQSFSSKLT